jgi:hypothetical protein
VVFLHSTANWPGFAEGAFRKVSTVQQYTAIERLPDQRTLLKEENFIIGSRMHLDCPVLNCLLFRGKDFKGITIKIGPLRVLPRPLGRELKETLILFGL